PCLKFSTLTFLLCIYLQSVWCTVQEVFKSQGFNELSEDALSFVLQSDQLQMDEEDILAKVTEWATVNSVVMGQTLGEVAVKVINHVRFGLLDPEKLSQIERDNQQKNFVPVPLISAAWKFHALKKVDVTDPQTRPRAGTVPRESLRVVGLTPQ
ncbi:BTB/POZ domain-containing protein 19, partial [Geodia barretti]